MIIQGERETLYIETDYKYTPCNSFDDAIKFISWRRIATPRGKDKVDWVKESW